MERIMKQKVVAVIRSEDRIALFQTRNSYPYWHLLGGRYEQTWQRDESQTHHELITRKACALLGVQLQITGKVGDIVKKSRQGPARYIYVYEANFWEVPFDATTLRPGEDTLAIDFCTLSCALSYTLSLSTRRALDNLLTKQYFSAWRAPHPAHLSVYRDPQLETKVVEQYRSTLPTDASPFAQ